MEDKSTQKPVPYKVIGALADAFGKSPTTIERWIEAKDDRLISDKARRVFSEENFKWNSCKESIAA